MAKMMGPAHRDSATSRAACKCGRKVCSDTRKAYRRSQRRIEKVAVRREIREEVTS